jgi:hypothetical protein
MPSAPGATSALPHAALADPLPCQRRGGQLWFSEMPAELEQAKAYCQQCPLRAACLAGLAERNQVPSLTGAASCRGSRLCRQIVPPAVLHAAVAR